jgi:Ubiquitin family
MHWTGENFSISNVNLGWSLERLKQHIFELEKIAVKRQTLMFNGKALDSTRSLRQQGLQHKSILVMEGRRATSLHLPSMDKHDFMSSLGALPTFRVTSIDLTIRHWLGHEFVVEARPSDYLDDLKETIFEKKKIPIGQQRITYKGAAVDETEGLGDQGITNGCVLQLEPMEIVIVTSSSGKELRLVVDIDDTIRDVKQQISKRIKVPIEQQCIMLGGVELRDSTTLQESEVEHQDVLRMEEFAVSVMHWTGDVFRLSGIRPDSTISDVKMEILRVRYVLKPRQLLSFKGVTLQDNKTLADESIGHKSVLILEEMPEVEAPEKPRRLFDFSAGFESQTTVTTATTAKLIIKQVGKGISYSVEVDRTEYADDIRKKIYRDYRIPTEEQRLSLKGLPIREDIALGEQGIVDGSVLQLDPMRIFVQKVSSSGEKVSLEVEKDWTIRFLKQQVIKNASSSADDFCIMLGGEELHDGKCLLEYGIKHDDTLVLEVFQVAMVDSSGLPPLDIPNVRRESTVLSVKQSIARLKSIPIECQQLSFQGKIIMNKKTLSDEGIRHKSILVLEKVEASFDVNTVRSKIKLSVDHKPSSLSVISTKKEKAMEKSEAIPFKGSRDGGSHDVHGGSDSESSMDRLDAVLAKLRTAGGSSSSSESEAPTNNRRASSLRKAKPAKAEGMKSPRKRSSTTTSSKVSTLK